MDQKLWNACYNVTKMGILLIFITKQRNIVQMIANMHKHKLDSNIHLEITKVILV